MTRPRRLSGVMVWMRLLAAATKEIWQYPATNRVISESW